ncbi:MAG: GntR family transcriptional regulator [Bacteroidota bacterium]
MKRPSRKLKETQNIPQHRRLYELIRKHIEDGVYKEGDLLPSENDFCRIHGVTRPTVRLALLKLVNEGYIRKQQGKGSIVSKIPKGIGILSVMGTTHALKNHNLKTTIIDKPQLKKWPSDFMFPLSDLEIESGCIYMTRLRLLNNKPIFYDISHIPNINLPRFTIRNFENKSLLDIMRKAYQIEVKGGEQKIKALIAQENICEYLQLECQHPVLHLERKLMTNKPELNIYSSIFCNTEDHAIYGTF